MASQPTLFMWSTDFATDIAIIDDQHQQLIEMLNEVVKLSLAPEQISEQSLAALKKDLSEYVVYHFGTEEGIMSAMDVDVRHVQGHRYAHEQFTHQVEGFFSGPEMPTATQFREFSDFLIRWLAYHILNQDKGLARQIKSIEGGASPSAAFEAEKNEQEINTEPLLKALQGLFYIISEKNLQLEKVNEELEAKVRTRTRELERANEQLALLAVEDELTKLPNRRFAMETLEQLERERERYETPFSVIMVDADNFKCVNDTYGHDSGDRVLCWIASFLRTNTRKSDIVCRLGGDEFLVICPRSTVDEAEKLAASLRERAVLANGRDAPPFWKVSLSLGPAGPTGRSKTVKTMLEKADAAMYADKAKRRP